MSSGETQLTLTTAYLAEGHGQSAKQNWQASKLARAWALVATCVNETALCVMLNLTLVHIDTCGVRNKLHYWLKLNL
jgi:hypothetical protein